MPEVLLTGAFGQGNPGDEALLASFLAALPGFGVWATSADPAATADAHPCRAVAVDRPTEVWRALRRCDAVVFGGGTIFKILHPSTGRPPLSLLRRAHALSRAANLQHKPVAMIGVGAGALPTAAARRLAVSMVRAADLLVLRDEESARILQHCGAPVPLRVGADIAWCGLGTVAPTSDELAGAVLVVLSHLAGGRDLVDHLVESLRPVLRDAHRVLLQPWQVHPHGGRDDTALAGGVAARLGRDVTIVPAPPDLRVAAAQMAAARVVVGMRFHALVAAAAAGTPFVGVAHEAKLAALARRCGQTAVRPSALVAGLAPAVTRAVTGPPPSREVVATQIAEAEEALRLLRVVLTGGRTAEADDAGGLRLEPTSW